MAEFINIDIEMTTQRTSGVYVASGIGLRTDDCGVAGYLMALGFAPSIEIDHGHVVFSFPYCTDITSAVRDYNSNAPVPCLDLVHSLKGAILEKMFAQYAI